MNNEASKMRGRPLGFRLTEETKKKISEALRGRRFSAEAKKKMAEAGRGNKNSRWSGGKTKTEAGYVKILIPDHPGANCYGYVLEHRLVVEKDMKRYLMPDEIVHHWNGIVDDNRPENLLVCNIAAHNQIHQEAGVEIINPDNNADKVSGKEGK